VVKNKIKFIIACMLFTVLGWTVNKHPFYLSVTELKYNTKEKALQGSVKIFTNDLEDALKKINGFSVDLINGKDKVELNKILYHYLQSHLEISADDKIQTYELLGFENEQEATWIYIEIKNIDKPIRLSLKNTILFDYLKGQSNIVHVTIDDIRKSWKVNYPDAEIKFDF